MAEVADWLKFCLVFFKRELGNKFIVGMLKRYLLEKIERFVIDGMLDQSVLQGHVESHS